MYLLSIILSFSTIIFAVHSAVDRRRTVRPQPSRSTTPRSEIIFPDSNPLYAVSVFQLSNKSIY